MQQTTTAAATAAPATKKFYHNTAGSRFVFGGNKENANGLAGKIAVFVGKPGAEGMYETANKDEIAELDSAVMHSNGLIRNKSNAEVEAAVKAAQAKAAAAK